MPQNWFFDIYEDTPEEEASNYMEHSTSVLDISSDEETEKKEREDKGKENVAPPEYEAPVTRASVAANVAATRRQVTRRKIVKADEMDDGERSPLSDLETEDFYAEGLTKESVVVVEEKSEKSTSDLKREIAKAIFAAPIVGTPKRESLKGGEHVLDVPVVDHQGDVKGDILIWEDGSEEASPVQQIAEVLSAGEKRKREKSEDTVADENASPAY